jgi:hypothetical protein
MPSLGNRLDFARPVASRVLGRVISRNEDIEQFTVTRGSGPTEPIQMPVELVGYDAGRPRANRRRRCGWNRVERLRAETAHHYEGIGMRTVNPPPGLQRELDDPHDVRVPVFVLRDKTVSVLEHVDSLLIPHKLEVVRFQLRNPDEVVFTIRERHR